MFKSSYLSTKLTLLMTCRWVGDNLSQQKIRSDNFLFGRFLKMYICKYANSGQVYKIVPVCWNDIINELL